MNYHTIYKFCQKKKKTSTHMYIPNCIKVMPSNCIKNILLVCWCGWVAKGGWTDWDKNPLHLEISLFVPFMV